MATYTPHHPFFVHPFDAREEAARRGLPSASSSSREGPILDWVLVDRRVAILDRSHRHHLRQFVSDAAEEEELATPTGPGESDGGQRPLYLRTYAAAATGDGDEEVYLHLGCPPTLSLALFIDGAAPARAEWRKPSVLAADAGRILLRVPASSASDLLLFNASQLSLVSIPAMPNGRFFQARGVGFISRGNDFVVALCSASASQSHDVVSVVMFSSSSSAWTSLKLEMPAMPPGVGTSAWRLDSSVSYGNCITWVDFSRGMITCDVLEPNPVLYFLSLPTDAHNSSVNWLFNNLCVSAGVLRFLRVKPTVDHGGAIVTVYTLDTQGYCWNDEGGILLTCGPYSPQSPILDGHDPNILYFLLPQAGLKYVHAINWKTRTFLGKYLYMEEAATRPPVDTPFIGSEISLHVANPPGIVISEVNGANGGYEMQAVDPLPRRGRIKARKVD